jgi:integrase
MGRKLPLYVYREINRHGNAVFYFRKGKGRRVRLPDYRGPDDPVFGEAYQAALGAGFKPLRKVPPTGTLAWLIERYRESAPYRDLSYATRRQRDNIFKGIVAKAGGMPVKAVAAKNVRKGLEERAGTPAQARHYLDTLKGMFGWAVGAGLAGADPTAGVKPPKRAEGDGFAPWTDADVTAYEARWPAGTKERVWMHVLYYTGFRRGDAVRFGRQHVKDGIATIRTEKTGTEVTFRLHDVLVATLAAGPTGDLAYIVGEKGSPLKKESFGNQFRAACAAAGVSKSAHGLRKLAATRFAEAGASEAELDARFGWTGRKMASLYTKRAERRRLALQADDRLDGTDRQRTPRTHVGATPRTHNEIKALQG